MLRLNIFFFFILEYETVHKTTISESYRSAALQCRLVSERIATENDCSVILMSWLAFRYTAVGVAQFKNDEQLHLLEMQRGLPKDVGLT